MRGFTPIALAVSLLATTASAYPSTAIHGSQFKAAMVYNIARFATWPQDRFSGASAPVTLCVAPGNSLAAALVQLEGQPVGARRLKVRTTSNLGAGCHIAVVDASVGASRAVALQHQGVLTISDNQDTPGVVRLVKVGRQTRFEVDMGAARQAGVGLSSQLLRLAVAVK